MKKRISSSIQVGVLVLTLIAIYVGISDACTFVGYVGQPDGFNSALYLVVRDHLPKTACTYWPQVVYAGWSVKWYATNPTGPTNILRVSNDDGDSTLCNLPLPSNCEEATPSEYYTDITDLAEDEEPTVMIAHFRSRSGCLPS